MRSCNLEVLSLSLANIEGLVIFFHKLCNPDRMEESERDSIRIDKSNIPGLV